jgi:hypothetical protein
MSGKSLAPFGLARTSSTPSLASLCWDYSIDIERTVTSLLSNEPFPTSTYRSLSAQQNTAFKRDECIATNAPMPLASLRIVDDIDGQSQCSSDEHGSLGCSRRSSRRTDDADGSELTDTPTTKRMPSFSTSVSSILGDNGGDDGSADPSSSQQQGQEWIMKLVNEAIARQQLEQQQQLQQQQANSSASDTTTTTNGSDNHDCVDAHCVDARDWHDEFQTLRSRYRAHTVCASSTAALDAIKQMQQLQDDFNNEVKQVASTIMHERNLPVDDKTIKPLSSKHTSSFVHNGIQYKVAIKQGNSKSRLHYYKSTDCDV